MDSRSGDHLPPEGGPRESTGVESAAQPAEPDDPRTDADFQEFDALPWTARDGRRLDLGQAEIEAQDPRAKPGRATARDRLDEMVELRLKGYTLDKIADVVGVTRERVRQILKAAGGPTASDAREVLRLRAAEEDESRKTGIRDLLNHRGAMTISEVANTLGIPDAEVGRLWPNDLRNLRVHRGNEGAVTWSDEQVLHAIQTAGTFEYPLRTATYDELVRLGEVDGPTSMRIGQRYGSWSQACTQAGVEAAPARRNDYQSRWTDDDLLGVVADYLDLPGSEGTFAGFDAWRREQGGGPSSQTVRNRLGPWSQVKARASMISRRVREGPG